MKEVNSLSCKEAEEQHKKNRDKEILCLDNKSYGMIKLCRDREKLGRDINCRRIENGQGNCVAIYNSMSRQTAQQATRIRKEKFVVTKEFPVKTEIAHDSKKFCHDRENSVATELTG